MSTKKFVAVLNKNVNSSSALADLIFMTSDISQKGPKMWKKSTFPYTFLRTKNPDNIIHVRDDLLKRWIPFVSFIHAKMDGSWSEKAKTSQEVSDEDIKKYGICLSMEEDEIYDFRDQFSLYNMYTDYMTEYTLDNPKGYWFKNKIYGWGWTPVTWQGWLTTGLYIVFVLAFAFTIDDKSPSREVMFTGILPIFLLTIALIRICYKKGEAPRWQWGLKKK
jgi:hypothetical protein